jgi:hypothetical protein
VSDTRRDGGLGCFAVVAAIWIVSLFVQLLSTRADVRELRRRVEALESTASGEAKAGTEAAK